MRRWGVWRFKVAMLLATGLAVPALAADPPDDGEPKSGFNFHWASWMQDSGRPPPKKRTTPATKPKETPAPKPEPPKANIVDRIKAERERENKIYFRRVGVCDELRRVALETHDELLERKVDKLEERAKAVYEMHTSHLPGHNVDLTADERTLDRHLGTTGTGQGRGTALYPGTGNNRGSQTAMGEDKP